MNKIWKAYFEFSDFASHFYRMSDAEIVEDIRKSIDVAICKKIENNQFCFLAKCLVEAENKMEKRASIGRENIKSRWDKEQPEKKETPEEKPAPKPKRPPNVSPDGEVIEQKKPSKMSPPTQEEVNSFATESLLNTNEAKKFFCYYDSNGWRVGKNPMKNWKSAFKGWCARATETQSRAQPKTFAQIDEEERQESYRKAQERINNYGK